MKELTDGQTPALPAVHENKVRPAIGNSLREVIQLANIFRASGYFKDVRDEAQAVTKILYGRELGFTPIVSIMGINVIDGKPALTANLMATLVRRSGKYDYQITENTNMRCAIIFRIRAETGGWEDLGEAEFTLEDAKMADLLKKDNWRKYPKAMLFARALSAGVRAHCPDVSACPLYVPEELGAIVTEEGTVTELPKGSGQEVTTEPKKYTSSAAGKPVQDVGQTESALSLPKAAETTSTAGSKPRPAEAQERRPAKSDGPAAPISAPQPAVDDTIQPVKELPGCITIGQAINFERAFQSALRPALRKDARQFSHDWLQSQGILADGKPTAYAIRAESFFDCRTAAIEWAKSL